MSTSTAEYIAKPRRYSTDRRYSNDRRFSSTRRYSTDSYYYEDESGLRLIRKSGIPILYVLGICANVIGMICLGIITDYWANIENPTCFLYAQTASLATVYSFGSSLSNCYWIAYGALPSSIIALGCAVFYMIYVFGDPESRKEEEALVRNTRILLVLMIFSTVLLLAVCCTIAEGMRISCTNMGINSVNGKADGCMEKLDLRVAQYSLPVKSSTMIGAGAAGLWSGMFAFFLLVVLHFISLCRIS